ncbi:MAG: M4 family metallopeptidase [Pseudoxanthomonas sp.]
MSLSAQTVAADLPDYNSDLGSHFFYLLSEGAVVPPGFGPGTPFNLSAQSLVRNGNTGLRGIGHNKACAIWYNAISAHFSATMSFPAARAATLQAARELHGEGSPEYNAVGEAWNAMQDQ